MTHTYNVIQQAHIKHGYIQTNCLTFDKSLPEQHWCRSSAFLCLKAHTWRGVSAEHVLCISLAVREQLDWGSGEAVRRIQEKTRLGLRKEGTGREMCRNDREAPENEADGSV